MRSGKNFLQNYVSWKNLNFDLLFKPEKYNDDNKIEEISKKNNGNYGIRDKKSFIGRTLSYKKMSDGIENTMITFFIFSWIFC